MVENGGKWSKMIENDEKWNDWKWLKMVENDWKMIENDETWNDCMVPSRVSCLWLEVGRHYKIRTQVSPVLEWAATIRYEEGLSSLCSGIKVGRHYKIRRAFPCLWGWLDSGDPPLQKGVWLIWWPQPLGCWWTMPCMILIWLMTFDHQIQNKKLLLYILHVLGLTSPRSRCAMAVKHSSVHCHSTQCIAV